MTLPRLQAVYPATAPRRREILAPRRLLQATAAACVLAGLAAVAGALWLIYPPAGLLAGGLELVLVGGAVAYTAGGRS